ncbi:MAG: ComF family protein [Planctomycetes bacterium]|nr:ComF family protein [Planctomycetota bacterium]
MGAGIGPLHSIRAALAAAIWPERCSLCAARDAGDGLGCAAHRFVTGCAGPRCGRCARALAGMLAPGERCPACRARAPGFACVAAVGDYRAGANATWLLALKYGGRRDLAQSLGALLAARLALEPEPRDGAPRVLVPVPLHLARRLERGYDQAHRLAAACGFASGVPVVRPLRRARATGVQGALWSTSRAANVRGAFRPAFGARLVARRVRGAECWLVDDVLTSGATAAECARVLRRLGAARVGVLCVARA